MNEWIGGWMEGYLGGRLDIKLVFILSPNSLIFHTHVFTELLHVVSFPSDDTAHLLKRHEVAKLIEKWQTRKHTPAGSKLDLVGFHWLQKRQTTERVKRKMESSANEVIVGLEAKIYRLVHISYLQDMGNYQIREKENTPERVLAHAISTK